MAAEVHPFVADRGVSMQGSFPVSNTGLAAASKFLAACMGQFGLGEAVTHRFSVILDEICANMIRHDPSLDESKKFTVEVTTTRDGAQLRISDPGQPFNPLDFRHAQRPEIGGHGITLVKGLANAASYERSEGMNCLTVSVSGS
ncbi:MAG: ATP-binding protein [Paracoccaceae bacterium]